MSIASLDPSGENLGLLQFAGMARNGVARPEASTDCSGRPSPAADPATYASVPLSETANCALPPLIDVATPSTTGAGSPIIVSRWTSNAAANSVPSRRYTR